MADEIAFQSSLAPAIQGLIQEKWDGEEDYERQIQLLHAFDRFWSMHGRGDTSLSIENLDSWFAECEPEGVLGMEEQVGVLRDLGTYLNRQGIDSYVPEMVRRGTQYTRHLFSREEIQELFTCIDQYKPADTSNELYMRIAAAHSVLFRMIYLNGMDVNEVCHLTLPQVHMGSSCLSVRGSASRKDRVVYQDAEMNGICESYLLFLQRQPGPQSIWLFPGTNPKYPISLATVAAVFDTCWDQTSFAGQYTRKPTVDDLSYTYIRDTVSMWVEEGLELEQMLPYLFKQLGYSSMREIF